jgi:hypothetical protein
LPQYFIRSPALYTPRRVHRYGYPSRRWKEFSCRFRDSEVLLEPPPLRRARRKSLLLRFVQTISVSYAFFRSIRSIRNTKYPHRGHRVAKALLIHPTNTGSGRESLPAYRNSVFTPKSRTTRDATSPCSSQSKIPLIDNRGCRSISALTLPSTANASASAISRHPRSAPRRSPN